MDPSTILCLGQARTLTDAATAWEASRTGRHLHDLDRMIRWAIELEDSVHDLQRRAWRALWAGEVSDAQATGLRLTEVHQSVLRAFQRVAATVELAQVAGSTPRGVELFEEARKRIERVAEDFREGWPVVEPDEIQAAQARIDRGEFGTLEDLTGAAVDHPD